LKLRLLLSLGLSLAGTLQAFNCPENVESGAPGWSMDGLWHIADTASSSCAGAHSGSRAFYFGRDSSCDYNDGLLKDASLNSPTLAITAVSNATLSFWTRWQVESVDPACQDQLWLEISDNGGAWTLLKSLGPSSDPAGGAPGVGFASVSGLGGQALWDYVSVNLNAYIGHSCAFRFRFLTHAPGLSSCPGPAQASEDAFLGWVVDDVSLGCQPYALSLAKSASPAYAAQGDTVTYTINAKNLDSGTQSLQVWDSLPADADFVSASGGGTFSAGLVHWSLPSMSSGSTQKLTLLLEVDPATPYPTDWLNTAQGSSSAGGSDFQSPQAPLKIRPKQLALQKSASAASVSSGDAVTYSISLSNYSGAELPEVDLTENEPAGFSEMASAPAYASGHTWAALSLLSGETRVFTVWGSLSLPGAGSSASLVNSVSAAVSATPQATAQAAVMVQKVASAQLLIHAVYPQPAPSLKPGLPQSAFVYYEINQAADLRLEIYSVSGSRVRSIDFHSERGKQQVEWDLNNDFGNGVASGVYLARLSGSTPSGKVQAWTRIAVAK
jgi:uncharacterized repeat protein (TIGR01451 family)